MTNLANYSAEAVAVENGDSLQLIHLLRSGAPINQILSWNGTLLHLSVDREFDEALQSGQPLNATTTAILIAFGIDLTIRDFRKLTALEFAESIGHEIAAELIRRELARADAPPNTKGVRN